MEFDREGPEGGMEIYTSLQNGKVLLECKVYLRETAAEEPIDCQTFTGEESGFRQTLGQKGPYFLEIRVWDREDHPVLYCRRSLEQEEPARGLLIHPHLWQGTADPYLYRICVTLTGTDDEAADEMEDFFALRTLREIPGKGWRLNDEPFEIRPVAYAIPASSGPDGSREVRIRRDLELMRRMGANTVCPIEGGPDREFCRLCDEAGLVVWLCNREQRNQEQPNPKENCKSMDMPVFYGTQDSLLSLQNRFPTDLYYFYQARWSREPFVYISAESLRYQKNGNAEVTVYSNEKKAALYVEGILFEFQSDGPDFRFQDIPVKKLPLLLTAEAGERCMSLTAVPFTEFSQNSHFSMTFTQ